ncbi:hypothetical protein APHAL10511_004430 [Amanita phalloides]|nr:hypothetical protein APHAL10511_004430 [Amanita phalloides]
MKKTWSRNFLVAFGVLFCTLNVFYFQARDAILSTYIVGDSAYCPQTDVLVPQKNKELWNDLTGVIGSDGFQTRAVDWLANAVRVPTESFDDFAPVGSETRWEKFTKFHDYLSTAFPQVHATLELTKVNTYGLLFTWKGQELTLKPILLAAHQDVVPVEPSTWDSWKHPPFSGHFDGEKIWGRGSSDDKSGLIAVMSAVELMIERKYQPMRTVVLAFGFDEEVSGGQGAAKLARALEDKFGKDGFAFIVDEGAGFAEEFGSVFAIPAIAEKGYVDVKIEVATAGGHSSVPPPHTSIGILSALLVHYENHPFRTHFKREDPLYNTVLCYAQHAKALSAHLRWLIKLSTCSDIALRRLEKHIYKSRRLKSQVSTTQAIDMIRGGVKVNALPEMAYAIVNHRISALSSVAAVQRYDTKRLKKLASHYNLSFNAFGESITSDGASSSGALTLSNAHVGLEPSPVTPSDASPYLLLSGTIKATFNSHRALQGSDNIYVAPGMMTGNTDTRYYWDLSKHIFRYNHQLGSGLSNNIHTVNESIRVDAFLEMIRFFMTLILNADESIHL